MHFSKILNSFLRCFLNRDCKKYYDKFYVGVLKDLGIDPSAHVEGEEEWVKTWQGLKIKPNPIYYRLFSHYCGNKRDICPEDICRRVIEPCLNPQRYRGFYDDKNSWDVIHSDCPFPSTIVRCVEGLFYTNDYKRIMDVDDRKLRSILNSAGGGDILLNRLEIATPAVVLAVSIGIMGGGI